MVPVDSSGVKWPTNKANIKLNEFRNECIAILRAKDAAVGIPADGKVYHVEEDARGKQSMVINYALAHAKHAGNVRHNMTLDLWEAFCAKPQDPSLVKIPFVPSPRKYGEARTVVDTTAKSEPAVKGGGKGKSNRGRKASG